MIFLPIAFGLASFVASMGALNNNITFSSYSNDYLTYTMNKNFSYTGDSFVGEDNSIVTHSWSYNPFTDTYIEGTDYFDLIGFNCANYSVRTHKVQTSWYFEFTFNFYVDTCYDYYGANDYSNFVDTGFIDVMVDGSRAFPITMAESSYNYDKYVLNGFSTSPYSKYQASGLGNYIVTVVDFNTLSTSTPTFNADDFDFTFNFKNRLIVTNSISVDNISYNQGYQSGYSQGYEVGNSQGYDLGYTNGDTAGYNRGVNASNTYTFGNLFRSIVDTPIWFLQSLFGWSLFGEGTALIGVITSLVTALLLIAIVKKVFH